MSKDALPLNVADISPFARSLLKQLKEAGELPSHLGLLNILARASGYRNYQHLRASDTARERLKTPAEPTDFKRVEKTLQQFDAQGVLIRWPSKRFVQELCMWAMWAQLPSRDLMQERDVNGLLNCAHAFDDAAILRRSLIGLKLVSRNLDGSDYQRIEQRPPPEAVEVIGAVMARKAI